LSFVLIAMEYNFQSETSQATRRTIATEQHLVIEMSEI